MAQPIPPAAQMQTTVVETSHSETNPPRCRKSIDVFNSRVKGGNTTIISRSGVGVRFGTLPPGVSIKIDGIPFNN